MIKKTRVLRSDFLGVYCSVSDDFALVPYPIEESEFKRLSDILGVNLYRVMVGNSPLIGSLVASSSLGVIVAKDYAPDDFLVEQEIPVLMLNEKLNAIGNNIIMNRHGAIAHTGLSKASVKLIEDTFGIEVIKRTIGGIKTVGSVAVMNERGMLVTPTVTEDEIKFLEDLFRVQVKTATANFGSIYVGSAILTNSNGTAVGMSTTPIELGRIDDTLS